MRRNKVTYSITSSATPNSAGGIVMPSVFAVLRLIDSIILVGNFAGRRAVENFVCEIGGAAIAPATRQFACGWSLFGLEWKTIHRTSRVELPRLIIGKF